MRARLVDVAARAGVSEATVSRVLNDRPGVSEATRQSVLRAVDLLGYQLPERLRPKTFGTVGLIVPELSNPVFPRYVSALERALLREHLVPVLCSSVAGGLHEDDYVRMLVQQHVAGIVFVCGIHSVAGEDPARYLALRESGTPFVLVEGHLPGAPVTTMSTDDTLAVHLAVDHLGGLGHRTFGLVAGPLRYTAVQRRVGAFHAALARQGEGFRGSVEHDLFTLEGGYHGAERLLDRGVTALICASDVLAIGAMQAVRGRGLRVPEDVSVVGSDDSPTMEFIAPPLTTIAHPVAEIADATVQALLGEIAGRPVPRAEALFSPTLVVRASTAPAPVGAVPVRTEAV
ncbi:LacI family DNA-binding transcriptional regulator [Kineococcus gynurae]|uniref:LacI family DNA-binding transcriptional regulator n=1 Tax=Kineococcus gynurae TaxID=452979 RepID=A0ABV5LP84_9ACTN